MIRKFVGKVFLIVMLLTTAFHLLSFTDYQISSLLFILGQLVLTLSLTGTTLVILDLIANKDEGSRSSVLLLIPSFLVFGESILLGFEVQMEDSLYKVMLVSFFVGTIGIIALTSKLKNFPKTDWALFTLVFSILTFSSIRSLNVVLDFGAHKIKRIQIAHKFYGQTLPPLCNVRSADGGEEYIVSREVFNRIAVGDYLDLKIKSGFFGLKWILGTDLTR